MTSLVYGGWLVTFRCLCGSEEFYRCELQDKLTFLEGYYLCQVCELQHSYDSDSFIISPRKDIKHPAGGTKTQLTLNL